MQKRCGPVHSRSTPSFRTVSLFFFGGGFYGHFLGVGQEHAVAKMINMYNVYCGVYLCASNLKQLALRNESSQKIKKHGRLCAISMAVVKWLSVWRGSTTVWGNRCSCFLMIFHHSPNGWLAGCFRSVIDYILKNNHMKGNAPRTTNHRPEPPTNQCWNYISAINHGQFCKNSLNCHFSGWGLLREHVIEDVNPHCAL